jgi:hypothetical protein
MSLMKFWFAIVTSLLLALLPSITFSLTVKEILLLKENGVSEETIQMMLESEARATENAVESQRSVVRTIVRPNGQKAIVYSTGNSDQGAFDVEEKKKEELAWEMLRYLIIDTRNE